MKRWMVWGAMLGCALGVVILPRLVHGGRWAVGVEVAAIVGLFPPMLVARSWLRRDRVRLGYGTALVCAVPAVVLAASAHGLAWVWAWAGVGGGLAGRAGLGGVTLAVVAADVAVLWATGRWYLRRRGVVRR